ARDAVTRRLRATRTVPPPRLRRNGRHESRRALPAAGTRAAIRATAATTTLHAPAASRTPRPSGAAARARRVQDFLLPPHAGKGWGGGNPVRNVESGS